MDIEAQELLINNNNNNNNNNKQKQRYICYGMAAFSICFSIIVTTILVKY